MEYNKIGVIGAGTMGVGLSADLLFHNKNVVLVDISEEILNKAKTEVTKVVRFAPLMGKGIPKLESSILEQNIEFTTKLENVVDCDIIIENVTEDWNIKQGIYCYLNDICPKDTIFVVDTSCISITKVGGCMDHPERVIGIHFMNPVYVKKTVEVIKGYHTSQECIDKSAEFLKEIDKKMVLVNDFPGFVTNRISHLFMNEAAYVVQDGVATPAQVDEIFRECFGHTMGPLETADLIGLDTVMKSLEVLYNEYQDPKFRCCPLLRKMVNANVLGKKTRQGFYKYK